MEKEDLSNVWPEWKIVKRIGRGSFGVVYEAVRTDHSVESHAAVKVISIPQNESEIDALRSEGLSGEETRTYLQVIVNDFVNEIQLMESFKGVQNIVSVEDYKVIEKEEEIGWDIYIRMELLTPLTSYISDKTLTEKEVIRLGKDICTALELCAKRNVIHRDIKPENIFLNQFGDYKLGDFGIARKLENMTGGMSQKGTYSYMAPEIERGTQYDATVDLYSLGLVLYRFMNKNRLPFLDTEKQLLNPNERVEALRRRMSGEALPAPCEASKAMSEVILRACAYEAGDRYGSAEEMKEALTRVENGTYPATEDELDKTVSVRHAPRKNNENKTVTARKAPDKKEHTFGNVSERQDKKSNNKIWRIMISMVFVTVLFVLFMGMNGKKQTGNNMSAENDREQETISQEEENERETVDNNQGFEEEEKAEEPIVLQDDSKVIMNGAQEFYTLDEDKTKVNALVIIRDNTISDCSIYYEDYSTDAVLQKIAQTIVTNNSLNIPYVNESVNLSLTAIEAVANSIGAMGYNAQEFGYSRNTHTDYNPSEYTSARLFLDLPFLISLPLSDMDKVEKACLANGYGIPVRVGKWYFWANLRNCGTHYAEQLSYLSPEWQKTEHGLSSGLLYLEFYDNSSLKSTADSMIVDEIQQKLMDYGMTLVSESNSSYLYEYADKWITLDYSESPAKLFIQDK